MSEFDELRGATVDGTKVDLAVGVLRMMLHAIEGAEEVYWQVTLTGLSRLDLARAHGATWRHAVVQDVATSTTGAETTVELTFRDEGSLSATCLATEVAPMGRVEQP